MQKKNQFKSRGFFKGLGVILKLMKSLFTGQWQINGSHYTWTLFDVYQKYCDLHLPTVTEATRVKFIERADRFFLRLFNEPISTLTPERISDHLKYVKLNYVQSPCTKRYNFQRELRDLKGVFQWWGDQYDFKFKNPVRPFHKALSVMEYCPEKERVISTDETMQFLSAFPVHSLYHDIAVTQFYCAARIGEIVGLQTKNIDLVNRKLKIKEVMVWIKGNPKVKPCPKNGKAREVYINDTLFEILSRRLKEVPVNCLFVFHDGQGNGLRFNRINAAFNQVWKKVGLSHKFSGSHLMRFACAQAARRICGSLDAAASVTGHQSMRMAAHYGKLDQTELNQSSVSQIEKHMLSLIPAK
jgi:integrase